MKLLIILLTICVSTLQAIDLKRLVSPETITSHREALALTPEQEAELTRIYESAKIEAEPLEAKIREEEKTLDEKLRSKEIDGTAAETNFTALLEAEGVLKRLQFKTHLALRAVLTPDQIEKAVSLSSRDQQHTAPLEAIIEGKANRLKAAFDELEIKPAPSLQAKGEAIMELAKGGDLEAADKALDELGEEVGINEPVDTTSVDFSALSPGNTDLEVLKSRLEAVEAAAENATTLPILRKLLQGRDELEAAKAAEDAERAGRVLTWAEGLLGITTTAP